MADKKKIYTGYKATDKNICCRGYQFEVGKWHKHSGELSLCESGFHFCEYPSGPWTFYDPSESRLWMVEARGVEVQSGPGAGLKHVCQEIRLVEEIEFDTGDGNTGDGNTGNWNAGTRNTGDWNTGYRNTGNRNAGDYNAGTRNTGDWNTGNRNAGNWNTGDGNTGNWNTGDGNTGNWNTGNRNAGDYNAGTRNTGNWNTGNRNAGNWNTGNWNTGDGNTGDRNTGDGNCTNFSSGFFNSKTQPLIIFDKPCDMSRSDLPYHEILELSQLLSRDEPFDYDVWGEIPNATPEKVKSLHEKHIAARKKAKNA